MDDEAYESIFRPVIAKVMEQYQPGVVGMCCGADSLSGDRVGCWNLSFRGHAAVLDYVKTFNLPMLVLGGGGYTIRNVARCWCYETSRLLNQHIPNSIPWHEYMDYYAPEYKLHVPACHPANRLLSHRTPRLLLVTPCRGFPCLAPRQLIRPLCGR